MIIIRISRDCLFHVHFRDYLNIHMYRYVSFFHKIKTRYYLKGQCLAEWLMSSPQIWHTYVHSINVCVCVSFLLPSPATTLHKHIEIHRQFRIPLLHLPQIWRKRRMCALIGFNAGNSMSSLTRIFYHSECSKMPLKNSN